MSLEYFPCYDSYLTRTRNLTDQEVGRLFRALMKYHATGEPQELKGRESMAYDFMVVDIDSATATYAEKCKTLKSNGQKGASGSKCPQMPPDGSICGETKTNTKTNNIKLSDDNFNISASAPVKHTYGECRNVLLTDEELEKLKERFPDWQSRIDNLSTGIAVHGYKYKSHYHAILQWAKKDDARPAPPVSQKKQTIYGSGEVGEAEMEAIRRVMQQDLEPLPWQESDL